MLLLKYRNLIIKFIICSIALIVVFLILSKVFYKKPNDIKKNIITSSIEYTDDKTSINVKYPRFNSDKINKIITDYLYSYIKDFRNNKKNKSLIMKYSLYYINDVVNIQFNIDNSLNNVKYYNMFIDLKKESITYISSIFDEEYLKNDIYHEIIKKYSKDFYNKLSKYTVNNYTYIFNNNYLVVYFNNFKDTPNIKINFSVNQQTNDNSINKHKYLIFTYDDGPSEYTLKLLEILNKNNSSATFFMLGDKMKQYVKEVQKIYNSNSEIGSHGYSLSCLEDATNDEIDTEISVTNSIFYEITKDRFKYYRPALNCVNDYMNNLDLELVNYDIDSKDWLLKDSKKIYENVINSACDGCVVLFHDKYKETVDATELLIPELKKYDYEIISISNYKNISN